MRDPAVAARRLPSATVRLAAVPGPLPPAGDVAVALRAAAERLGHRPAITVVRPDRRDEQGYRSLLKWTSKGAHLLALEALLEPGDRLALQAPPGWIGAAVAYAAWWQGIVVTEVVGDVVVVHEGAEGDYAIGGAFDGSPEDDARAEPWPVAVQTFPDDPPTPAARAELAAVAVDGASWSHAELLDAARSAPTSVEGDAPMAIWLPAVVRPLVTGEPLEVTIR